MTTLTRTHRRPTSYWRAAGPWLVLASAGYLLVNVLRVFLDPADFARYFGLPVPDGETGWVYVYASRTALLAGVALILLARRELRLLSIYAALSVLGPVSDGILAVTHHAPGGTIVRHAVVGVFLIVVAALLARQHRMISRDAGTDR